MTPDERTVLEERVRKLLWDYGIRMCGPNGFREITASVADLIERERADAVRAATLIYAAPTQASKINVWELLPHEPQPDLRRCIPPGGSVPLP